MKRVVLWGAANRAELFYSLKCLWKDDCIVGVVDKHRTGLFHQINILHPRELSQIDFDTLVICSKDTEEIMSEYKTISAKMKRKAEIIIFDDLYAAIKTNLINKYVRGSEEYEWVSYFNSHDLSVWGRYKKIHTENKVFYEEGHPYILLNDERLFYPDNYEFAKKEGDEWVYDVLAEQGDCSPHLYVRDPDRLIGGCIVDAGTCEGNFAIRFARTARKLYLIENDPRWLEPLERTFFPYREKTVICGKKLGRYTTDNSTCLDDLVESRIDFLKMDIEGAEIDALLGGKRILLASNAECAISSYHRYKDEENIKFIMQAMGYEVSTSGGFMFYMYDEDIAYTSDIRRGIVYCKKD